MRPVRRVFSAIAAFLALTACGGSTHAGFTQSEWAAVKKLSPLPTLPADPTNRYADNDAAARFGQILFFEKRFSGPIGVGAGNDGTNGGLGADGESGKVACADCHSPNAHYSDNRSRPNNLSLGAHWGSRNSPSILDVGYYQWFTWAGRLDSLWAQGAAALESPDMAGDRCGVAHYLWDDQRDAYDALFADKLPSALDPAAPDAARFPASCNPKSTEGSAAWASMTPDDQQAILRIMSNAGKAIAAYERKVVSGPAPFDRFVAGDEKAISDSAKRGLRLFIGRGFCVECHSGPNFSDDKFHNLGVPQMGSRVPAVDDGRYTDLPLAMASPYAGSKTFSDDPEYGAKRFAGLTVSEADHNAFRTKDLRGVADTAPYFHDGCMPSLWDVLDFYDAGGGDPGPNGIKDPKMRPLNLTPDEKADLIEFLRSLSGPEPTAEWGAPP